MPSNLRAVLAQACPQVICIASANERFAPGTVYIGAPSQHLTLATGQSGELVDDPNRVYGNRTIDLLFASVAKYGEARGIGVVLAGAADDGSRGLAMIGNSGGLRMVVTPVNAPWRGMPENDIEFDRSVDVIGSPLQIAAAIAEAVGVC